MAESISFRACIRSKKALQALSEAYELAHDLGRDYPFLRPELRELRRRIRFATRFLDVTELKRE